MASLYTPSERCFDIRLEAIDHCQIGLLRELSSSAGARLTLKGGMAMRAAFGSMRLTKDIDFDRDPTISQDALKKNLERSLLRAANIAKLSSPKVQVTKDSGTTLRVRLEGALPGKTDVRFDVEVSGRTPPAAANLRSVIVAPPARYSMAPFPVVTFQLAEQELLPYLPPDERQVINEDGWIEMTLMVADTIQGWCKDAMKLQQARHRPKGPI